MEKLVPLVTAETRHLFVDPAVCVPWNISMKDYPGCPETSYLKPGKVPNLMDLCKPEGARFSITEEPNPDTMTIDEIVFGVFDIQGNWYLCVAEDLGITLEKDGAASMSLNGHVSIDPSTVRAMHGDYYPELSSDPILVELNVHYARGTRCFQYSTTATYDNQKPQVYGLALELDYKDSKIIK